MVISDAIIQEIKNRIDIVEVISDFVTLKKLGAITEHSVLSQTKKHLHFTFPLARRFLNVLAQVKEEMPSLL